MMQFNCWLLGDHPRFIFSAKVTKKLGTVSDLQQAIKGLDMLPLHDFEYRQLMLWKVNIDLAVDSDLLTSLELDDSGSLGPWLALKDVFTEQELKTAGQLHVVIRATASPLSPPATTSTSTISSEAPRALHVLNDLCRDFWKKPLTYLAETFQFDGESVSYRALDLKRYAMALKPLGFSVGDMVLIRTEYKAMYDSFTEAFDQNSIPCYSLQGQPGVGKTLFLLYALLYRMSIGLASAFHITTGVYFILGNSASVHEEWDPVPLHKYPGIWCLSNSNGSVEEPAQAFIGADTRVIQAASLRRDRSARWLKVSTAGLFAIMDVWSRNEIASLAHALFGLPRVPEMVQLISEWGPAPRDLVNLMRYPQYAGHLRYEIEMAAKIFARHPGSAVGFNHEIALESVCSRVLWVRPDTEKKGNHDICISPMPWVPDATRILSHIKAAVQDQSAAEQTKFFTVCCAFPGTRCAAGYILQDRVYAFFSGSGKTLTWHSSPSMPHTVKIPDDVFVVEVTTGIRPAAEAHPSGIFFRPALANFPGIDGAFCTSTAVYCIQCTVSYQHKSAVDGLESLRKALPPAYHGELCQWHLLFACEDELGGTAVVEDAKKKLEGLDRWNDIPLGYFVFPK